MNRVPLAAPMVGRGPERFGNRRGQTLVEFALVLPILVLILFGIFDFGRAVYAYNTIGNAARQGARVAAVNQIPESPDCNQERPIENPSDPHWSIKRCAADAAIALGVTTTDVTVAYSAAPGSALVCDSAHVAVGCLVHVTVVYRYEPVTPLINNLVGSITMSSSSEVLVERVFP